MSVTTKGVQQVRIFEASEDGLVEISRTKKSKKKNKHSRGMRRPEKNARIILGAARTYFDEMENRHASSSNKKKDGWIRDSAKNSSKASRKAGKQLRKIRFG